MSEEILAEKVLKKYEKILLIEKEETLKLINGIDEIQKKGTKDRSGDLSSYSLHQADMGTDTDESEKRVYHLNKEMDKLKKLNLALNRIYEKTYGICEICGCLIQEKRLKVVPYAKFCIKCKSNEETNNRKK